MTEKYIQELEARNSFLERCVNALKLNNKALTQERNELIEQNRFLDAKCKAYHQEVLEITSMSMFEFAELYCNDKQLEADGKSFAKALLGVGQ